jgi:hypothetical protein
MLLRVPITSMKSETLLLVRAVFTVDYDELMNLTST